MGDGAACPDGWTSAGPSPSACYSAVRGHAGRLTLSTCVEFCGAKGGTVADVPDAATNKLVANLVEQMGLYRAYIGLYQAPGVPRGSFQEGWGQSVSGLSPTSYRNWQGGEPNQDVERCVALQPSFGGVWLDGE